MYRVNYYDTVIQKEQRWPFLLSTYARQQPGSVTYTNDGDTVEIIIFVPKISLLPNYSVKYYDYIVKWCGGVVCNWRVSLDIPLILALTKLLEILLFDVAHVVRLAECWYVSR